MTATRRRFLIIRNRHAGLASARRVAHVAAAITALGGQTRIIETGSAGDVADAVKTAMPLDAVVAAGGDGTVRALALTLDTLGLELPIGLIPAGTGNVLANEVGLPRAPEELARLLMHGPVRGVHIMQANEAPFLLMASSGFDAQVLLGLSMRLKQRVARASYAVPTLAALMKAPGEPFELVADGETYTATWVIVANARTYGGSFRLLESASIFDPSLTAVLFGARTRMGRLKELLFIAAGRAERCASVIVVPCRAAEVRAPRAMPSQIDGDPLGFGPISISASGRTVPLIVPDGAH